MRVGGPYICARTQNTTDATGYPEPPHHTLTHSLIHSLPLLPTRWTINYFKQGTRHGEQKCFYPGGDLIVDDLYMDGRLCQKRLGDALNNNHHASTPNLKKDKDSNTLAMESMMNSF